MKKSTFFTSLRNLWTFLVSFFAFNRLGFINSTFLRTISAIVPFLFLYLGKEILDETIYLSSRVGDREYKTLFILIVCELLVIVVSDLVLKISRYQDWVLSEQFKQETSIQIINYTSNLELQNFEDSKFYDKLDRITNQSDQRIGIIENIFLQLQKLITIITLIVSIGFINIFVSFIIVVFLLPMIVNHWYFSKRNYELTKIWTTRMRELKYHRGLLTSIDVFKDLKIFGLANFFKSRTVELFDSYLIEIGNLLKKNTLFDIMFSLLNAFAFYGVYLYFLFRTLQGHFTIGELVFISGATWNIRDCFNNFIVSFSNVGVAMLSLNEYYDFFSMKPNSRSPQLKVVVPQRICKGIVFENVSFKYEDSDQWAIRNLNCSINVGESIGILGKNGSGKTTFIKLLLRLYQPVEGRILLDEIDIKDFDINEYVRLFSVLFQDYGKFQTSAKMNIAVGDTVRLNDLKGIQQAAELGFANALIDKLPGKYDQNLGKLFPNGVDLSVGEWQRIALSRTYMRNASIYIYDEPTSALDPSTEREIFDRINNQSNGKIALYVTHRLSAVRGANKIIVFDNGVVVESGRHDELMKARGPYSLLFEEQAAEYG